MSRSDCPEILGPLEERVHRYLPKRLEVHKLAQRHAEKIRAYIPLWHQELSRESVSLDLHLGTGLLLMHHHVPQLVAKRVSASVGRGGGIHKEQRRDARRPLAYGVDLPRYEVERDDDPTRGLDRPRDVLDRPTRHVPPGTHRASDVCHIPKLGHRKPRDVRVSQLHTNEHPLQVDPLDVHERVRSSKCPHRDCLPLAVIQLIRTGAINMVDLSKELGRVVEGEGYPLKS